MSVYIKMIFISRGITVTTCCTTCSCAVDIKEINYGGQSSTDMDWDTQHLMTSHQFLLSGEVGVTTPATTYDKSDEALVKVVRLCSSLKPLEINAEADGQRQSEGHREEGKETKNRHGFKMTDLGERSGEG